MADMGMYFSGRKLYGDDFSIDEIEKWYEDEKKGYADLGAKNISEYNYVYHALNEYHGFQHLPNRVFEQALGLGGAYGDEFLPISSKIQHLTILDPSEAFVREDVNGIPVTYIKPSVDGRMIFDDGAFDLITSFGVLHHIPNVTTVVNEIARCLSVEGYALIREPIISMGDWTKPRPGLTKRERGIPLSLFREMLQNAGLTIVREAFCVLPFTMRLGNILNITVYNSNLVTWLDAQFSKVLKRNYRYYPATKVSPISVYYVLKRR